MNRLHVITCRCSVYEHYTAPSFAVEKTDFIPHSMPFYEKQIPNYNEYYSFINRSVITRHSFP